MKNQDPAKSSSMTREDAARIQSAEAKKSSSGTVQAGGFASRAQSAAAKNEPIQPTRGSTAATSDRASVGAPSGSFTDSQGFKK